MPAKIPTKFTSQQFYFEELDERFGYYEEGSEPTMIALRKATPLDEAKRADIIGGNKIRYHQDEDGTMKGEMVVNLDEIKWATVYAVLEDSNIQGENGKKAVFKGMSYERFKKAVGLLPPEYLDAFYEKALEVNPQWKPGGENF